MSIRRPPLTTTAAALCAGALLAACGSSSGAGTGAHTTAVSHPATTTAATSAPVASGTVTIHNYMFMPMAVTVKEGGKLTFTNDDATSHTATAAGAFDTGTIRPGKSVTITFKKAGTFSYKCLFHAFMTAKITVVPA